MLGWPGFGAGPVTIGAELELCLVDDAARPLPRNQAVRALAADPRIALELNRFNLELNSSPVPLAGPGSRPFATLAGELGELLDRVGDAARTYRGRVALIGILPTLGQAHLGMGVVTDAARYRALDRGLRRLRQGPFVIRITGAEPLELTSEHVTPEGANTSFQVHLRVAPGEFTRIYNAAQLATGPALAVAGNSPTFLGHRLWEETRIALFKQSVEDRDHRGPRRGPSRSAFGTGWLRGGALELFTESVRLYEPLLPFISDATPGDIPHLAELRLHQSTVWRWNRAIYDPASGGHLRIEMRALPAGPTMTDMLANAAFLIGLTLWLADRDERWTYALPFERADHGFYRAAQYGLAAELSWPADHGDRVPHGSRRGPGTRTATGGPAGAAGRRRGRGGGGPSARGDRRTRGHRADRGGVAARHAGGRRMRLLPGPGPRGDVRPLPVLCGHRRARPHLARAISRGDAPPAWCPASAQSGPLGPSASIGMT